MSSRIAADYRLADYLAECGAKIRTAREKSGLTQQDVGDICDWQRDMVSKTERGQINISHYDYLKIMAFLGDFWDKRDPMLPAALRLFRRR